MGSIGGRARKPRPATLIAGVVVLAGFLLTALHWGFIALVAVGTFGPGILRELGILRDQDEFQRRSAHRAGYHAYLACGFVAFLIVGVLRSETRIVEDAGELATLLLVVLWFTWLLSSLLSYWGARRTAARILIVFGSAWLLFNVIGNMRDPIAMIMQCLVAVPFFLLAYVAKRWPRIAGIVLLAVAAFFFWFFGLHEILGRGPLDPSQPIVVVLFIGPLLASGMALLVREGEGDSADETNTEEA